MTQLFLSYFLTTISCREHETFPSKWQDRVEIKLIQITRGAGGLQKIAVVETRSFPVLACLLVLKDNLVFSLKADDGSILWDSDMSLMFVFFVLGALNCNNLYCVLFQSLTFDNFDNFRR